MLHPMILIVPLTISACFWAFLLCPLRESFKQLESCRNGSSSGCQAMTVICLPSEQCQPFLGRNLGLHDMQARRPEGGEPNMVAQDSLWDVRRCILTSYDGREVSKCTATIHYVEVPREGSLGRMLRNHYLRVALWQ